MMQSLTGLASRGGVQQHLPKIVSTLQLTTGTDAAECAETQECPQE